MSHDHKPDLPKEEKRILDAGGRVFAWGVPRVWLKEVDMPGLAVSRSFGDLAAESVGVWATPECIRATLTKEMPFLILASDGVWEFLSSQEAVDIVAKHYSQAVKGVWDAQAACDALITESVQQWNREEDVVDDITAVVLALTFK